MSGKRYCAVDDEKCVVCGVCVEESLRDVCKKDTASPVVVNPLVARKFA